MKKPVVKTKIAKDESTEQVCFADVVGKIISPTIENFGFIKQSGKVKEFSTEFLYRNGEQYIRIYSTSYPRDYPWYFSVILGEGNSDDFFEYDWNSVPLSALIPSSGLEMAKTDYYFPVGVPDFESKIKFSVEAANKDLIKYGATFLEGDLTLFHEARKKVNDGREPYMVHSPGSDGTYKTTIEPKSAKQKQKYS